MRLSSGRRTSSEAKASMPRAALGCLFLLLAGVLLMVEVLSILARFAMFAGASEIVSIRPWGWADVLRLLGVMVLAAAGFGVLRGSRRQHDGAR
jgi:hypothetical protein